MWKLFLSHLVCLERRKFNIILKDFSSCLRAPDGILSPFHVLSVSALSYGVITFRIIVYNLLTLVKQQYTLCTLHRHIFQYYPNDAKIGSYFKDGQIFGTRESPSYSWKLFSEIKIRSFFFFKDSVFHVSREIHRETFWKFHLFSLEIYNRNYWREVPKSWKSATFYLLYKHLINITLNLGFMLTIKYVFLPLITAEKWLQFVQ